MTQDEFNATKWTVGMVVIYNDWKYNVIAINFMECLVALSGSRTDGMNWVRCESIQLEGKADEQPKFTNVFCSQCGKDFGPGDHGYSHCENHAGRS